MYQSIMALCRRSAHGVQVIWLSGLVGLLVRNNTTIQHRHALFSKLALTICAYTQIIFLGKFYNMWKGSWLFLGVSGGHSKPNRLIYNNNNHAGQYIIFLQYSTFGCHKIKKHDAVIHMKQKGILLDGLCTCQLSLIVNYSFHYFWNIVQRAHTHTQSHVVLKYVMYVCILRYMEIFASLARRWI